MCMPVPSRALQMISNCWVSEEEEEEKEEEDAVEEEEKEEDLFKATPSYD